MLKPSRGRRFLVGLGTGGWVKRLDIRLMVCDNGGNEL